MSERGKQLLQAANLQIAELLELLSTRGQDSLGLPCAGRQKLGDGTVGATAQHATRVYHLLAQFIATYAAPRSDVAFHLPDTHDHQDQYERVDVHELLQQLASASSMLSALAQLTDGELDTAPPSGSFRFCDGHRTLEQVIASVLNHQSHHITAISAALE